MHHFGSFKAIFACFRHEFACFDQKTDAKKPVVIVLKNGCGN